MADKSAIQWTDATWNPTTGCDRVSPGCAHCYALDYAPRLQKMAIAQGAGPDAPYMRDGDPRTSGPGFGLMLHPDRLDLPLRWSRPRRIFVNSMSDLFHPEVPDDFIDDVFAVMAAAPWHIFQVLTKRPERMRAYIDSRSDQPEHTIGHAGYHLGGRIGLGASSRNLEALQHRTPWPLPNVWLGTSVENARWRTRIDQLRATSAAVRFLSLEPLLGPVAELCPECDGDGRVFGRLGCCPTCGCAGDLLDLEGIGWVIVGGESGPEHRPVDGAWIRAIRDACERQGAAFFFKQWGGRTPKSGGRELDGRTWDEFPRQAVPA